MLKHVCPSKNSSHSTYCESRKNVRNYVGKCKSSGKKTFKEEVTILQSENNSTPATFTSMIVVTETFNEYQTQLNECQLLQ